MLWLVSFDRFEMTADALSISMCMLQDSGQNPSLEIMRQFVSDVNVLFWCMAVALSWDVALWIPAPGLSHGGGGRLHPKPVYIPVPGRFPFEDGAKLIRVGKEQLLFFPF